MKFRQSISFVSAVSLALAGCGGGGGTSTAVTPPPPASPPATVYQAPASESLSVADVQQIIAQSVAEAQARNTRVSIAVVDRVGNLLATFIMSNANLALTIPQLRTPVADTLPGNTLPNPAGIAGALAKAITGAYLSSGGNAFSSRTASQIVQQHFPPSPTTVGIESGPLYGVQFSQLPCSDLSRRFVPGGGPTAMLGPKRSPVGLAADPGGFPLYKNGVLVGGIGVFGDGIYGFDSNTIDIDVNQDEFIALAGTRNFDAPAEIRADRISVDGTSLRYSDATIEGLMASGATPTFASLNGVVGSVAPFPGYGVSTVLPGAVYGSEASGIRAATSAEFSNRDAFVLTDGSGNARYPIRGGTDSAEVAQPLTQAETRALLEEAFLIMSRARGQIRRPLDSRAQVSISVVDTFGSVLGLVRAPDAPVFGIDVSLQKARTVAFLSNSRAAAELAANPDSKITQRLALARTFFNDPAIFTGKTAWSDRAVGNISRPFFPDGQITAGPGPFSPPVESFNPFHTGLQSELVFGNIIQHLIFILNQGAETPQRCTRLPDVLPGQNRLSNGLQIFPGAVPIYRGSMLVGAIGISGDGIDQDDMVSFLGANNGGARVTGIGNAPAGIRSDQLVVQVGGNGVRLRYVSCPFAPFLDTTDQNVCQGH